jgi:hypothetical protein
MQLDAHRKQILLLYMQTKLKHVQELQRQEQALESIISYKHYYIKAMTNHDQPALSEPPNKSYHNQVL